jgi:hypothetical protein
MRTVACVTAFTIGSVVGLAAQAVRAQSGAEASPLARFFEATREDNRVAAEALQQIAASWRDGYASMFLDLARMMRGPRRAVSASDDLTAPSFADGDSNSARGRPDATAPEIADRGSPIRRRLLEFLGRQTRQSFGDDLDAWRRWIWSGPYDPHPEYAALKGVVYSQIDPRMRAFFPAGAKASIRLDEIDWGA